MEREVFGRAGGGVAIRGAGVQCGQGRADASACDYTVDQASYAAAFNGSAITRAKRWMVTRNGCVLLGNVGTTDDLAVLGAVRSHEHEIVREHAEWALRRIDAHDDARSRMDAAKSARGERAEPGDHVFHETGKPLCIRKVSRDDVAGPTVGQERSRGLGNERARLVGAGRDVRDDLLSAGHYGDDVFEIVTEERIVGARITERLPLRGKEGGCADGTDGDVRRKCNRGGRVRRQWYQRFEKPNTRSSNGMTSRKSSSLVRIRQIGACARRS